MAIRKKRRENGNRADPTGSKPHSNGDAFSRSMNVFLDSMVERSMTMSLREKIIRTDEAIIRIFFPKDWFE